MSNYIVSFHPSLTKQQIQELLSAIRLLQGVTSVGERVGVSAGSSDDLLNMDFSGKNSHNSYQRPNSMGKNVAPPDVKPMNYQPPSKSVFSASPNISPPPLHQQNTQQQAEEQSKMIAEIIKWGVHNKKVSMQQLESSSAEGTIEMAKQLIELMPNSDRERILNS